MRAEEIDYEKLISTIKSMMNEYIGNSEKLSNEVGKLFDSLSDKEITGAIKILHTIDEKMLVDLRNALKSIINVYDSLD